MFDDGHNEASLSFCWEAEEQEEDGGEAEAAITSSGHQRSSFNLEEIEKEPTDDSLCLELIFSAGGEDFHLKRQTGGKIRLFVFSLTLSRQMWLLFIVSSSSQELCPD